MMYSMNNFFLKHSAHECLIMLRLGRFSMNRIKEHSRMNVKQCSLCAEYTEYYCHSCQKDLCQQCKAVHVIDLNTKHHEVTIYREKFNYISKREKGTNHQNCIYKGYCESCEVQFVILILIINLKEIPFMPVYFPKDKVNTKWLILGQSIKQSDYNTKTGYTMYAVKRSITIWYC